MTSSRFCIWSNHVPLVNVSEWINDYPRSYSVHVYAFSLTKGT